jgi:hypothetical protein
VIDHRRDARRRPAGGVYADPRSTCVDDAAQSIGTAVFRDGDTNNA